MKIGAASSDFLFTHLQIHHPRHFIPRPAFEEMTGLLVDTAPLFEKEQDSRPHTLPTTDLKRTPAPPQVRVHGYRACIHSFIECLLTVSLYNFLNALLVGTSA
jgi:hypothetical protein